MSSKPKQTAGQKELERSAIEREKQLRVERARETTRAFSENVAFRKKLRGIYSLLSGGFAGFPMPLGSGGGRVLEAGSGGGGGGSAGPASSGPGTSIGSAGGGSGAAPTVRIPRRGPPGRGRRG